MSQPRPIVRITVGTRRFLVDGWEGPSRDGHEGYFADLIERRQRQRFGPLPSLRTAYLVAFEVALEEAAVFGSDE